MSWTETFARLHQQLAAVHPTATAAMEVDRQTMISMAKEIAVNSRHSGGADPFKVEELKFYGIKVTVKDTAPVRVFGGDD